MSQESPLKPAADLAETLRKLVAPFTDPVFGELGHYVADKIRWARFKNTVRVLERAEELIGKGGAQARTAVPPRVLVPLLEASSLEDDDFMTEQWARLLAAAATGSDVRPSFVAILSELTPSEAKILHNLWAHIGNDGTVYVSQEVLQPPWEADYVAARGNLERLRLVASDGLHGWSLTAFGRVFMAACTGESKPLKTPLLMTD